MGDDKMPELILQMVENSRASRNFRAVGFHYSTKKRSYPRECRFLGFESSSSNLDVYPSEEVGFCIEENCSHSSKIVENNISLVSLSNLLCKKLSTVYQPVVRTNNVNTKNTVKESDFLGYIQNSQNIQDLFGDEIDFNIIPKKKTNEMFIEIISDGNCSSEKFLEEEKYLLSDELMESKVENEANLDETIKEVDVPETNQEISEYERIRLDNIKERNQFLIQMGLYKDKNENKEKNLIKVKINKTNVVNKKVHPTRRSLRISNGFSELLSIPYESASDNSEDDEPAKKVFVKRPNSYGVIKGVPVGEWWGTRLECNAAGIHRPTVAGIHPGPKGAFSVVLSGGYDDDVDCGDSFTYTGSGGRDLKGTKANPKNLRTAPQTKNQTLNLGNAALVYSCEHKKPIRVVRGYKLKSPYAPEEGYRYDGLYLIEKWWLSEGISGFLTYKFYFKRCTDQDPPPWQEVNEQDSPMQVKEE